MPPSLYTRDELIAAAPRFSQAREVRFQDVDAAGIVFYPVFLEYFHDAYADFLTQHGCPLHQAVNARLWAAPLKRCEADFMKPLRFGDPIQVALVGARIEGSEVVIGYQVSKGAGQIAAVGQTVHVFVDPTTFKRTALPEALARAMASLA